VNSQARECKQTVEKVKLFLLQISISHQLTRGDQKVLGLT